MRGSIANRESCPITITFFPLWIFHFFERLSHHLLFLLSPLSPTPPPFLARPKHQCPCEFPLPISPPPVAFPLCLSLLLPSISTPPSPYSLSKILPPLLPYPFPVCASESNERALRCEQQTVVLCLRATFSVGVSRCFARFVVVLKEK